MTKFVTVLKKIYYGELPSFDLFTRAQHRCVEHRQRFVQYAVGCVLSVGASMVSFQKYWLPLPLPCLKIHVK